MSDLTGLNLYLADGVTEAGFLDFGYTAPGTFKAMTWVILADAGSSPSSHFRLQLIEGAANLAHQCAGTVVHKDSSNATLETKSIAFGTDAEITGFALGHSLRITLTDTVPSNADLSPGVAATLRAIEV